MIVYSDNPKRAEQGFHKTAVCPCKGCVEFRYIMSPEGSEEIRTRLIEQLVEET